MSGGLTTIEKIIIIPTCRNAAWSDSFKASIEKCNNAVASWTFCAACDMKDLIFDTASDLVFLAALINSSLRLSMAFVISKQAWSICLSNSSQDSCNLKYEAGT